MVQPGARLAHSSKMSSAYYRPASCLPISFYMSLSTFEVRQTPVDVNIAPHPRGTLLRSDTLSCLRSLEKHGLTEN